MSKLASRRASLCAPALFTFVAFAASAVAQDLKEKPGDPSTSQSKGILRARDRELIHPGEPLQISGLEQGDNEFRSRTPALAKSNRAVRLIDPEEAHRRALAMYADGASFSEPPSTLTRTATPRKASPRPSAASDAATDAAPAAGSNPWPWVLAVTLLAGLAAWVRQRQIFAIPKRASTRLAR